jgi:hypothetical protein
MNHDLLRKDAMRSEACECVSVGLKEEEEKELESIETTRDMCLASSTRPHFDERLIVSDAAGLPPLSPSPHQSDYSLSA